MPPRACLYPPKVRALVLALMSLIPLVGSAQNQTAPSGAFVYDLGPQQGLPLWNFGGSYHFPFYSDLQVQHYGNGSVAAFWPGYTNRNFGSAVLVGRVSGVSSRPLLMLRSRVALSDYSSFDFLGNPRRKDRFSVRFDSTAGTLTGRNFVTRIWDNLSFQGSGFFGVGDNVVRQTHSSTRAEAITLAAPDTTDGKWTLDLNLAANGNRIGGVGLVQLTNSELLEFQTMGTWLPKMQRANLLLKGIGAAKGSTLRLQLVGPQLDLGWLRGTVAGQGLHFP